MGKISKAVMGVAASAGVAAGAYGIETLAASAERSAIEECLDHYEGDSQEICIDTAESTYAPGDIIDLVQFAGVVGIVGCGYLGYKAVKEEVGTTGILEDNF